MKFYQKKFSISLVTTLLVFSFIVQQSFERHKWTGPSIIRYDVTSYYSYLPAAFIYHDFTFKFLDSLSEDLNNKAMYHHIDGKGKVQKMTMGVALLWTPFFLIANTYYSLKSKNDNGYGKSYRHSIAMAALFYALTGLIFLRRIFLKLFNESVAAIIVILIAIGTNLFNYTINDCGMSHVYTFCLVSVFVWLSIKWNENINSVKHLFFLLVIGGLITLIRPLNILILLFPFFYYSDRNHLTEKIRLFKKKFYLVPLLILAFLIPIIPQLLYWKYMTGHYIYYSYINERFYFSHPHILDGLLGFRKGLFIYTPFMLLIFPGLYFSFKKSYPFSLIVFVISIIFVYTTFSWWCWWYGGSFGARTMIDFYPLFCLPIAVCIHAILNRSWLIRLPFSLLLAFFVWLNLFQTKQYETTLLHYDSMNLRAYLKIFGTNQWPENYDKWLEHPDYDKATIGME